LLSPRGNDEAVEGHSSTRRTVEPDMESPPVERLQAAVMELYMAISITLEGEHESAREYLERAALLLQSGHPAPATGLSAILDNERTRVSRGGLAPWQIRCVRTHIEANLDATLRVEELAVLAKLSSFHFCRAFRNSFGESPHGYVMRRRVERAQGLMLTTTASLGQIAAECGLADQAHFNKLFRRFVGESPGMWRRARATPPG